MEGAPSGEDILQICDMNTMAVALGSIVLVISLGVCR